MEGEVLRTLQSNKKYGSHGSIPWIEKAVQLEYSVNLFGKGKNPWEKDLFVGDNAFKKLSINWEGFVTSKPKPSKKLRKRALIYGFAMVAKELDKYIKSQQGAISEVKEQMTSKNSEMEKLTVHANTLSAEVCNQTMQINQLEQQVKDLNMCLAQKDKDNFVLATKLADSQPALREMVKQVKIAKESSSNHASCNFKINLLKERLRKTQGVMSAIQMDPVRGYESQNTSDMDSDGEVSIDSKDAWEEAQAWVLSVAKDIIRNGLNGLIAVEMRKALWDNATTDFERQHQAWWKLVNYTYLSSSDTIVAYILTLLDAREE
ncbi:unnamed protein product [Caretta caretta]